MAVHETTATERAVADRERYVARGVATTPLVVARAEGARIWDVDGREYVDFAGGLGCQNTGHGFAAAAIHKQIDRHLHQCFMVGMYESYVEVCKLLDETWPGDRETKSLLVNSGAEAVENAVKIARSATGRPAVIVFDHAFHGRTSLTMAMTAKVVPYKQGFGPFPSEVYRAPAPYPYRGVSSDDAIRGLELLLKQDVDPTSVACVVLEPVQGEGGFVEMPADFPARRARRDLRRQSTCVRRGGRGASRSEERLVPQARRRAGRADPCSPRAARSTECSHRRGARARPHARPRADRADAGPGQSRDGGRTRPRPRPPLLRYLRKRDSHPRPPHDRRCAARARPRPAGGIAWRRPRWLSRNRPHIPCLRRRSMSGSPASARRTATSWRSTGSISRFLAASSSRCSAPRAPAR